MRAVASCPLYVRRGQCIDLLGVSGSILSSSRLGLGSEWRLSPRRPTAFAYIHWRRNSSLPRGFPTSAPDWSPVGTTGAATFYWPIIGARSRSFVSGSCNAHSAGVRNP